MCVYIYIYIYICHRQSDVESIVSNAHFLKNSGVNLCGLRIFGAALLQRRSSHKFCGQSVRMVGVMEFWGEADCLAPHRIVESSRPAFMCIV